MSMMCSSRSTMRRLQPRARVIIGFAACFEDGRHSGQPYGETMLLRSPGAVSRQQRLSSPENNVWGRVFLQLPNRVESVKVASGAFGAAYKSSLKDAVVKGSCSTWRYYGLALARLQSDLNSESVGPESLALASMILACVEILNQHEQMHSPISLEPYRS